MSLTSAPVQRAMILSSSPLTLCAAGSQPRQQWRVRRQVTGHRSEAGLAPYLRAVDLFDDIATARVL